MAALPSLSTEASSPAARVREVHAFEARLAVRTEVSRPQAARLEGLPGEALAAEVRSATQIVQRFADAVNAAMSDPRAARSFVETLDLRLVTRDHDWRSIFGELLGGAGSDGHRERMAIWNYLAYLCSRRDLIESVIANRRALEETDEFRAVSFSAPAAHTRERLPRGLPVVVHIPYRGELEIALGGHAFRIVDGYPPKLADGDGREQKLRHGEVVVGRHPASDLPVAPEHLEVSRAHMTVEWHGDSRLTITDRSSLGTWVPASAIAAEQPAPEASSTAEGSSDPMTCLLTRYVGEAFAGS